MFLPYLKYKSIALIGLVVSRDRLTVITFKQTEKSDEFQLILSPF